jgi:glycosyltransferase involved in cell wall biosynthesis
MLISLKYQAFNHDEVEPIFICDSCDDLTHQMIEVYLRKSYKNLIILDREYHSSGLSRNDGLELASGDYIWLLDGDDWLIDNHAFKKVMQFFEASPDSEVLHVGYISNTYQDYSYLYTVWQWVWKAELAKAVMFTSRKYDDDVEWVQNMILTHNITVYPKWDQPFYFYNYMREDSVMFNRAFEELS